MRKLFVSIAVSLCCAVPFFASQTACSSGVDCNAKICPNDDPPTQMAIDQCKKQNTTCSSQCSAYIDCFNSHKSDVCTNGKTDQTKLVMVASMTCGASLTQDCLNCTTK